MTDQRVVRWGLLQFQDGSSINLPPIGGSQNGWVYKPDQLRTKQEIASGKNRSWPRGTGWGMADTWLTEYVRRHIESRGYEIPSSIEKQSEEPTGTGRGDALSVSWWNDPWGWTTMTIQRATDTYGRARAIPIGEDDNLTFMLTMHDLALMYLQEEIGSVHNSFPTARTVNITSTHEVHIDRVRGVILDWIADPVKETLKRLGNEHHQEVGRFDKVFQPPNLKNLNYGPGEAISQTPDDLVLTHSTGMLRLHQEGEVKRVLKDDVAWDNLNGILDAFRYLGYDLRIDSGYVYGQPEQVKSVSIELKPSEKHNELGHTIKIDAELGQITVNCGYAHDENLWVDRQARIAAHQMEQLEEDLWTETTINLERKDK